MKVIAEFCIIPLGVGVSLSPYIAKAQKILEEAGLKPTLHAYGTIVEGDWDVVFNTLKKCHQALHQDNVPRIHTTVKIGTRTDRNQTALDKVESVQALL